MSLTVRIADRIGSIEMPESPSFADDEQVGLRLGCPGVEYAGGEARLDLRLSYRFTVKVCRAYHNIDEAIVVAVEDAERGVAGAVTLEDPFVKPADKPDVNWIGLGTAGERSKQTGWANLRLDIPVPEPRQGAGPTLYVRATLREFVSNVVEIDLTALTATSR